MKVTWSPIAERRAREAVDWIRRDRPKAAAKWLAGLLEAVGKLDRMASRGRIVPEIGRAEYREIFHSPYRIVYTMKNKEVVILTIRHSRRAWDETEVP
ncbi:MAG: type II toxin-antitoxin system RelE/ParE family toxin [Gemmatimonadaceae bacterium]